VTSNTYEMELTGTTLQEWQAIVRRRYPMVQFTLEDGTGRTYGELGQWTAHTGPDMQADVIGVYTKQFADMWLV
jgi:hypothetical protein